MTDETMQTEVGTEENETATADDVSDYAELFKEKLAKALKKKPYACTGIKKTENGWKAVIEVIEEEHMPSKFDTIGIYDAEFNTRFNLQGWEKKKQRERG